jgi:uncharacterized protein
MKRTRLVWMLSLSVPIAAAAATAGAGGAAAQTPSPTMPPRYAEVAFPDRTRVKAEVAATEAEREHGLMMRTSLGDLNGMLFVFEAPGLHAFWMKDTLIPLDMLWLDAGGKVVSIAESVPPCKTPECPTYPPRAPASYVLEVNAGFANKHHVRVGDTLTLSGLDRAKRQPPSPR